MLPLMKIHELSPDQIAELEKELDEASLSKEAVDLCKHVIARQGLFVDLCKEFLQAPNNQRKKLAQNALKKLDDFDKAINQDVNE